MPELDDAALERRLRGVLKEHLGALPLDLTVDALDRRREAEGVARRSGRGRSMTLLAAAALLIVGGALAVGSGVVRVPSVVPPVPAPSFAVLATASPDATTTPIPSASPSPSPAPLSLDLTWTQLPLDEQLPRLAWIGDRFVLADVKSGAVRTSTDGQDWQALQPGDAAQGYVDLLRGSFASWQDGAVGWWNPQDREGPETTNQAPITARDVLQIVRPPAALTSTTPFKGRIESIGIGPRGMVAEVHSTLDLDAWITKKLGLRTNNDWTCCVKSLTFKDGVLELKLTNRRGLKVVWADQGFEPGDFQDGGFGWYSPDGEHWTAMAANDADYPSPGDPPSNLPTGGFGSVVGVSDGFIATGAYPDGTCADPNGSCTGMWYSSDGLTWRFLGSGTEIRPSERELCVRDGCSGLPGALLPWRGGALAIDGDGRIEFWTSGGPTELPIEVQRDGTVATGPLGLVSIGDGKILVSRDGIDHKVSSIPAQMADANVGGGSTVIAVGDRTVLVLEDNSLWLGTFEP